MKAIYTFGLATFGLLLLFGFVNDFGIFKESIALLKYYNSYGKCLVYLGTFFIGVMGYTMLLSVQNKVLATLIILMGSVAASIEYAFRKIAGTNLNTDDVSIFINAQEHVSSYIISSYSGWIFPFMVVTLILIGVYLWLKKERKRQVVSIIGVLFIGISFVSSALILDKSNGVRTSYPAFIKIPILYLYAQDNGLYNGPRDAVVEQPINESNFNHIIFVVDESVRGDLLQINKSMYENTPFLSSISEKNIVNFGTAYSAAVCSDYSNILLMSGVKANDLPDVDHLNRKLPTIFQYAQEAGFQTTFIDGQSSSDRPDGFMTYDDYKYIDRYIQTKSEHPEIEDYNRDVQGIEYLSKQMTKNKKTFNYVIKYGCHFPYENTYPVDSMKWKPIASIVDWNLDKKDAVLNNYHNSIRWTVDAYFKQLFDLIRNRSDVLIIYTSDHGQNLMDVNDITLTHCYKEAAPKVMAKVPLLMMSSDTAFIQKANLNLEASNSFNKSSHFNIFSTLKSEFGYKSQDNLSLLGDTVQQVNWYFSGDIFGRNPLYKNAISNE